MELQNSGHIVKPVQIKQTGRLKQYYDTQAVVQGDKQVHFFPPQVSRRDTTRNNYSNNPIPGAEVRKVLSIGVGISKTIFTTDGTNSVDAKKIVNQLLFGSLKLTLNSDNVQVLETPLRDFFGIVDMNGDSVSIQNKGLVRLADPFQIGQSQVFDVIANFADANAFPTEANWSAAGESPLELQIKLLMSEEPAH